MYRYLTAFLVVLLFVAPLASAEKIAKVDPQKYIHDQGHFLGYAEDRFIVVFNDEVIVDHEKDSRAAISLAEVQGLADLADYHDVVSIKPLFPGADKGRHAQSEAKRNLARHYKVMLDGSSLEEAMNAFARLPEVHHVEPVGIHLMFATPNDGFYDPYQWYHNQANDDDIDSPEAWDLQTGSSSVIVAILDSGTRYFHRDLGGANTDINNPGAARGNMWINNAELNGSPGVDDDGNGYVDDWVGYDFIETTSGCWSGEDCGTKDNDPRDFNGHGTHCSGIVGMLTNNGYGMAGVAGGWGNGTEQEYGNGVKVMGLRMGFSYSYFGQEVGVVYMDAAAEAFYYAADNGAKVASCSWGSSNSGGIAAAADYFTANGGLIFTAAGNDGSQTAPYLGTRSDVIAVAATDENDAAASFTTYGTWVDISAPGVGIYSTLHDHTDPTVDYWASMDGTSMACPMAAAVAAMIWSQNPGWSASQVETQLYNSAENIDAELTSTYIGKMGAGRINLYDAVNTGPPPAPTADFSGAPTSGTYPLLVSFTDLSTGSPTSWSWNFGDGGTSTAQNPTHTYTSAGTYTVTLTATNAQGSDQEVKTNYITVSAPPPPTAEFSGTPTNGEYPLNVDFTDLSSGNPTSWSWTFGDGGTSTAQNPSHTYNAAGTYTVSLTAYNSQGNDTETKTNYITVTEPGLDYAVLPYSTGFESGSFDQYWETYSSNSEGRIQITTAYTPRGTYHLAMDDNLNGGQYAQNEAWLKVNLAGAGDVDLSFWWKEHSDETHTQDGVFLSDNGGSSFTKVYNLTGTSTYTNVNLDIDALAASNGLSLTSTFVIKFQQYDNYGLTTDGMTFDDISVTSTAPPVPVAAFVGSPTSGNYPLNVNFTDQSTGAPTSWSWNFGDGGTSTAQNPSHTYTAAGTYTVTLTATNAQGSDQEVKTNYITVTAPPAPTAAFTGSPTSGTFPLNVNFTDQSTGSPTSWSWNFGDGGTSTAQNPSHTYTAAGTYTVTLTATNSQGSDDEVKVDYITVTSPPPPTADFTGNPTTGAYPLAVSFTDASTGSPTSWSWTFGDGGTSTAQNPNHTYTAAGTYTVTLTATNAYGSDGETKTNYITVTEPSADQWWTITYDDFESGWGNYVDGGGDCALYTGGTYAWEGSNAAEIRDNSGVASSFYHGSSYDVSGFSDLEIEFYFVAVSMDNAREDFWLQYYDGSSWLTVATWVRGTDFDNGVFYNTVVQLPAGSFNYPTNAQLRFMCDASGNRDWVYIDNVEFRGYGPSGTSSNPIASGALTEPVPTTYMLSQNYPNPFNPTTNISFSLDKPMDISLEIFNIVGQKVKTLASGHHTAGVHEYTWNASNVSTGVYFYRLVTEEAVETKKMVLMK